MKLRDLIVFLEQLENQANQRGVANPGVEFWESPVGHSFQVASHYHSNYPLGAVLTGGQNISLKIDRIRPNPFRT